MSDNALQFSQYSTAPCGDLLETLTFQRACAGRRRLDVEVAALRHTLSSKPSRFEPLRADQQFQRCTIERLVLRCDQWNEGLEQYGEMQTCPFNICYKLTVASGIM